MLSICYSMKNMNIKIRGSSQQQQLPISMASKFKIWTFIKEMNDIEKVEDGSDPGSFLGGLFRRNKERERSRGKDEEQQRVDENAFRDANAFEDGWKADV